MKFLSDILAKAGLTVDGVVTLNNTATGQTPNANDNSTKLATTAWVRTYVQPYSLPIASASVLGGIKVGSGLSIDAITGILTASATSVSTFRDKEVFTATAGQTTFTLQNTYTPGLLDVFVNGVYLNDDSYTASNGSTVVLDDATALNDIVTFFIYSPYYVGETPNARNTCAFTATSGQTTFSCSYAVGSVDVFYNGSKLASSEFTAINGTSIVLATACVAGDYVEIVSWLVGGGISSSRTITIDGVTQDLSANRTWNILPTGGAAGDILAKVSGTNYDVTWIPNFTSTVQHTVKAAVALTKGQAVYVSSADGTNMIVSKASNISEATSSKTLGLVAQNLAINGQGFVVTEGLLAGLNTGTANAGDPVWLGTDGNLIYGLVNKPYAPDHLVFIGVVTRAQQNNGEIFVKVQNGFELHELHNVSALNPSDGDMIKYVASTGLWTKIAATTTNIAEGTNLYYTNTRVASYLTANSYNSGTGTTNYLPKFTGSTTIGNSNIQDSGTLVTVGVAAAFSSTVSGSYGGTFVIPSESPASGSVALVAKTSNGANDIFRWFDGATPLGVFKNNGNVLIGTTTDNGARLQVSGTATVSSNLTVGNGTTAVSLIINRGAAGDGNGLRFATAGTLNWYIGSAATSTNTDLEIYNHNTATTNLRFNYATGAATFSSTVRTGGVSIGVASTANVLDVRGENNTFDGTIVIGARGTLQHRDGGQTITSLANDYNDNAAKMEFRMKGNTSANSVLTLLGSGAATFSSSITTTGLSTGTSSGSSVNITTNNNNGSSGSPLQTNVNFYGYNGNLNGQIRVDDIAGTAQLGSMKFYTWNSGQVLALTMSHTGAATFTSSVTATSGTFSGTGIGPFNSQIVANNTTSAPALITFQNTANGHAFGFSSIGTGGQRFSFFNGAPSEIAYITAAGAANFSSSITSGSSIAASGNISGASIIGSLFQTSETNVSGVSTSFVNSGTSFTNTTGIWLVSVTGSGDGNMYSAVLYVVTTAAYSKTINLVGGPSNHFGNGSLVAQLSTNDGFSAELQVRRTTSGTASVNVRIMRIG